MSFYITIEKKTLACMWVTSGSFVGHIQPDYSMGQWVKWVNKCDPLSTQELTLGLKHTFVDYTGIKEHFGCRPVAFKI